MNSSNLPQVSSNFTPYPLAWSTFSFIAGIFADKYLNFSWEVYFLICVILAVLTLIFFKRRFSIIFILIAFVLLGSLSLQIEKLSVKPNRIKILYDSENLNSGDPIELTGVSESKPELAVSGFFLVVSAEKITFKNIEQEVSGKVRLFLPVRDEQAAQEYELLNLGYGTKIRAACQLQREEKFQNPGGVSNIEILDQQGIDATAIVKSPLLIENLGKVETILPFEWIAEHRQNLIIEFKKHFSVSTAGVLIASLLGNKYHLDKTTAESFREGGTFHILVISGLQITFIGGLTILFLRQLTRNKFWQFLLASLFLWSYTLAVGADSPVTRAAIMFTVWYFAYVVFRRANLLNTLAAGALVLLIWKPSDIFNQSFQLTFICVFSIVAMGIPLIERFNNIGSWHPTSETPIPPKAPNWLKILCETLYWSEQNWQNEQKREIWQCRLFKTHYAEKTERWKLQRILRYVFETIVVSFIVQAWLLPFAVIYFHRISLASILLNVPVGALMAIESITAIIGIVVAQMSEILAAPFIWITEILNWLILKITIFFISQDWSSIRIPHYSGNAQIIYFLYFIPIVFLTILLLQWNPFGLKLKNQNLKLHIRIAASAFIFLLSIIIFHPFSAPNPDGKLYIDFLDVGQGDSALITMPIGETILVDGGGKSNFNKLYVQRDGEEAEPFEPDVQNIGETVVSNFLWEKGYDKVDYLLPTHADTDHIQGLTDVARNFKIKAALVARTPMQDEDFADFYRIIEKRKIDLIKVGRSDILTFGDVKIEILSPEKDENPSVNWDNNQSIVLRIIYGETKFLLTGDIEKEAERELLQTPEILQANVVKAAHHGSKTSSTQPFIEATKAKLVVISVGKNSPFGHPHEEVVERWKNSGAQLKTTGEKGTIFVSSNGKTIEVETFRK